MKGYLLGFSLLLFSATLAAEDYRQHGFYLGVGGALVSDNQRINIHLDDVDRRYRMGNVFVGYKHNSWLGAEVRYGQGLQTERREILLPGEGEAVPALARGNVDSYRSFYYRPELINELAKTYLLLGYTQMELSGTVHDGQNNLLLAYSDTESGASYGLGIGFAFDRRFNLNFEYLVILDRHGERMTTTGASVDFRFWSP